MSEKVTFLRNWYVVYLTCLTWFPLASASERVWLYLTINLINCLAHRVNHSFSSFCILTSYLYGMCSCEHMWTAHNCEVISNAHCKEIGKRLKNKTNILGPDIYLVSLIPNKNVLGKLENQCSEAHFLKLLSLKLFDDQIKLWIKPTSPIVDRA